MRVLIVHGTRITAPPRPDSSTDTDENAGRENSKLLCFTVRTGVVDGRTTVKIFIFPSRTSGSPPRAHHSPASSVPRRLFVVRARRDPSRVRFKFWIPIYARCLFIIIIIFFYRKTSHPIKFSGSGFRLVGTVPERSFFVVYLLVFLTRRGKKNHLQMTKNTISSD